MSEFGALGLLLVAALSSSALAHPPEQLLGEHGAWRVHERTEAKRRLPIACLLHIVRLEEQSALPRLRVRVDAEHTLVRDLMLHADYRIAGARKEYFVAIEGRFLLVRQQDSYVVFEILADALKPPNCS